MKKGLSVLLSLALLSATVVGCGSSGNIANDAALEVEVTAEALKNIGTEAEPVPVKIIIKDLISTDQYMAEFADAIEEGMAQNGQYVDITWVDPPLSDYGSNMPLSFVSGSLDADILYFQGGDQTVVEQGLLTDLTPYLEISEHLKDNLKRANASRIENYPYLVYIAEPRMFIPLIREDYAQQLSSYDAVVQDPSIENYTALFKEMKEKGLVEYALNTDGSLERFDSVFNSAFGINSTLVKEDGKWVFSKATENEKNKLEFYAQLYQEGLISPEFVTEKWDGMEQKFYNSDVGIICATPGDVSDVYNNKTVELNGEQAKLIALPPAKGKSEESSYLSVDITKEPRGFAINEYSENKLAAFAVLDYMASEEGRMLEMLGLEGIHYNVVDEEIVFTDERPNWWVKFYPGKAEYDTPYPLSAPLYSDVREETITLTEEYYKEDVNIVVPNDLTTQYDSMQNLYNQYATDIITGKRPISDFDEFVTKFNAAGGEKFSEYIATVLG